MIDILLFAILFCIIMLFSIGIMLYRNNIVYKSRVLVIEDFGMSDFNKLPKYDSMYLDFSCWTVRAFIKKHIKD